MQKIPLILSPSSTFAVLSLCLGLVEGAGLSGCGDNRTPDGLTLPISASATACLPGTAEILVGDGFLQNLCGCVGPGEDPSNIFAVPNSLTCHLAAGTTSAGTIVVTFNFFGTVYWHQIISVGPNNFGATPLFEPGNSAHMRVFGVVLQPATPYSFQDVISGMTGSIFVP